MAIKLGSTNFGSIYLGSTKIGQAYLGSVKVFPSNPPPPVSVTIAGVTYPTVTINGTTWTQENLDFIDTSGRITHYTQQDPAMGGLIPDPFSCYYNFDSANDHNGTKYGVLYNYTAIPVLEQLLATVAPGWHIPTIAEWRALFNYVSNDNKAALKLKSTSGWVYDGNGDGSTAFNALPAGWLSDNFNGAGALTYLASIDDNGESGALKTQLGYRFAYNSDGPGYYGTAYTWSVRLIYRPS